MPISSQRAKRFLDSLAIPRLDKIENPRSLGVTARILPKHEAAQRRLHLAPNCPILDVVSTGARTSKGVRFDYQPRLQA